MSYVEDTVTKKLNWAKENPSLCFFPYTGLDLRLAPINNGKLRVSCCCNLEKTPMVDKITSDPFSDLKQKLGGPQLPSNCARCIDEENSGGVSERIRNILATDINDLDEFAKSRKVKEFELRVLFSNVCNLSCRSCEPYSSSTYAKITANNEVDHLELDITDIDLYWNLIIQTILSKVNECERFYIHFMGGEPLLHHGNKKLVDWLIDNQLNDRVYLRITTSINIPFKKDFLEKIDTFRAVDLILSIDGVHNNYHYVRWPARFEKTIANLNEVVQYKKASKSNTYFSYILSPVFSLNNILYLLEYLDFWHSWMKENDIKLYFLNTNLLYRTRHLDIQALPKRYRYAVSQVVDSAINHDIIEEYPNDMVHLYNFLKSAQQELITWEENNLLWDKFLAHTAEFDVRTNVSFDIYNKLLYNILNDHDKQLFSNKLGLVNKTQKIKIYTNDYFQI